LLGVPLRRVTLRRVTLPWIGLPLGRVGLALLRVTLPVRLTLRGVGLALGCVRLTLLRIAGLCLPWVRTEVGSPLLLRHRWRRIALRRH
jgi:hypothetical protein